MSAGPYRIKVNKPYTSGKSIREIQVATGLSPASNSATFPTAKPHIIWKNLRVWQNACGNSEQGVKRRNKLNIAPKLNTRAVWNTALCCVHFNIHLFGRLENFIQINHFNSPSFFQFNIFSAFYSRITRLFCFLRNNPNCSGFLRSISATFVAENPYTPR